MPITTEEEADAATILDKAVVTARAMGIDCSGWMVQRDEEGFIAWLYAVGEQERFLNLMEDVEQFPTLLQAARWCLALVEDHVDEDGDEGGEE